MTAPNGLPRFDVDRLIPESIRHGDPETLRKARIAQSFGIALLGLCAIYIPAFALEGLPRLSLTLGIGALLLCLLPLTLRLPQPLTWAGFHIGAVTLGAMAAMAYYMGGIRSTMVWWMCMVPVTAMLVSGKRLALVMAGFQIAIVGLFYLASRTGYVFPPGPDTDSRTHMIFRGIAMLTATLVALAWVFEKAKDRALSALAAHNEELRLILDNVDQGFLCCDPSGTMIGRHSAIVESWFGPPPQGDKIWAYLAPSDQRFVDWLECGWSAIVDDVLPLELTLDQLPRRFTAHERHFQVEYKPVKDGDLLSQVVIVVTDITAIVHSELAEADQRELADALDRALRDRPGFVQFIEEGERLVAQLDPANPDLKRVLHTLKGNSGFYGARSVAEASHALEDQLVERPLELAELDTLRSSWRKFCLRLAGVLDTRAGTIEIREADFRALRAAMRNAATHPVLDRMVTELRYEPVELPLHRAAAQASALARRLNKGDIEIAVEACDVRLDPRRWKPFWSAFVHAIRNAVDHGIEDATERAASGKRSVGRLRLSAELCGAELVIALEDDGRGIDWDRVCARARSERLPHQTPAELKDALFSEGLSTRDQATEVSGRGIGLNAVRQAVMALEGRIELTSRRGEGTTLRLRFPAAARLSLPPLAKPSPAAA